MGSEKQQVALYARVSTRGGRQDVTNQLVQLRDFASRQGWHVVEEYVDERTGSTGDRPAFKRLFQDAKQKRFTFVLFWSLDRFSREGVRETLNHLNVLTDSGVGWRSLTEQYLDSCGLFKDAVLAILAVIAKQERVRLSERITAGLKRAKAKGTKTGNPIGRPKKVFARWKVMDLRKAGKSISEIQEAMGLSRGVVQRALAQAADES